MIHLEGHFSAHLYTVPPFDAQKEGARQHNSKQNSDSRDSRNGQATRTRAAQDMSK